MKLENGWVAFDLVQIEKKGGALATLLNVGIAHQFAYLLIYTLLNSEPLCSDNILASS